MLTGAARGRFYENGWTYANAANQVMLPLSHCMHAV